MTTTVKPVMEYQPRIIFDVPSDPDEIRWWVDRSNLDNPFHDFVGNDDVVKKLGRLAFTALGRETHSASDLRLAFLGPSGVGKTTAARKFADLLELPFCEVNPSSIVKSHDLFMEIARACEEKVLVDDETGTAVSMRLRPQESERHFLAPEMVVFIDECHQLVKEVEQALLTATEPNSHTLVTNEGYHLDTQNICWIVATTDIGGMFHALRTRFSRTDFRSYNPQEIARIVQIEVEKRRKVTIPLAICERIAFYSGPITREGIDFGVEAILEREMSGGSWEDAVETIRREKRIDDYGMKQDRLNVLQALGTKGALSKNRVCLLAQCQIEELESEVMPPLLMFTDGQEPLVITTSRGYQITERGLGELKRRGLPATAKAA